MLKIKLAQLHVDCTNPQANYESMKKMIIDAKAEKCDIIIFPEMSIGGYFLMDKYLDNDYCHYLDSFNQKIADLSEGIGIIYGNLYYGEIGNIKSGRDGRKARYNAAFFFYDKKPVKKANAFLDGIHLKHLNPDYRIFDDSRYFLSGIEVSQHLNNNADGLIAPFIFEKDGIITRIGLEVCEDMWSDDYNLDVTQTYADQGVDLFINISSSPYTRNKELSRDKRIREHALRLQDKMKSFIYVNCCGMQNTGKNILTFDGDSCVYDDQGKRIFELNDSFNEESKVYDFKTIRIKQKNQNKLIESLTCAIREFDDEIFNRRFKWIIGLSGGIDSSINAALLVKALGSERVIGYNMASNYNSLTTKNNARTLAEALNIELREGSIEALNEATISTLQAYGYKDEYYSLTYENIQARIRGHLLCSFASVENGVICNNANKIEVALGYCTLYGDSIGSIAPLGDLSKVELFKLAEDLNNEFKQEVIPTSLIPSNYNGKIDWEMPPSAELKDNQVDPMKWYYHDLLIQRCLQYPTGNIESLLEKYLDGSIYNEEIGHWIRYYHLDDPIAFFNDLEWVLRTMAIAIFKRIQMPPIVVTSRGAFGNDFREAQLGFIKTERYEQLKAEIIAAK